VVVLDGSLQRAAAMPPFDPIEPPHAPPSRRLREDINPVFPCGICDRPRVDLYAIAYQPDTYVICQRGTLRGCGLCGDGVWIDIDDAGLADPVTPAVPSALPVAAE
jgi:hypothetical protein